MPEPVTVLQYVAAAVGVAKFLVSERLEATVSNIRAYFSQRNQEVPEDLDSTEGAALVALLVIDADLLSDLTRATHEGIYRYRECLKNADDDVRQRDACDRRGERDVCDTLNRIRDRNKDDLPTDFLREQWNSFRCVRV